MRPLRPSSSAKLAFLEQGKQIGRNGLIIARFGKQAVFAQSSGMPPTAVAQTGVPLAMASMTTLGVPSRIEESAKTRPSR